MPGGNNTEDAALYQIACLSGEMAVAAGGTAAGGLVSEDDITFAIACNFRSTLIGLGATPCAPGWVDIDSAWLSILLYSSQLATATSGPSNAGSTATIEGKIYGTLCNLIAVSTNTGQTAAGTNTGSSLAILNAIACALAQIVDNGFTPPDPVQEFIDAVNAFGPDRFFLYGRGMFSNSGGTTPAAPGDNLLFFADQSGNVDHLVPNAVPAGTPSIDASSVLLDGATPRAMTQAYTNSGDQIFVIAVVQQSASAPNAFDRIASFSNGGDDYNSGSYFLFFANPATGDLGLFWNGGQRTTMNPADITDRFHTVGALINAGTNVSKVFKDAAVQVGTASSIGPLGITHFGIGFQATSGDGYFRGQYKAAAVWNTVPSDADITTIIGLFRTFYGTP